MIYDPIWWGQMIRSTAIEHADIIRDVIKECLGDVDDNIATVRFLWDDGSPMPTAISIQTETGPVDLTVLLKRIQPFLGEDESMIFAAMTASDVCDRGCINYYVVTRHFIGNISGDAIVKKVEGAALAAQEELQKELDAQGSPA